MCAASGRMGGGGAGGAFLRQCAREGRNVTPLVSPHTVPPAVSHAHGASYQSTLTTSPCIANTAHTGGGGGGLVAESATHKCVTGLYEKPTHTTFGGLCAFTDNHPNTCNRPPLLISRTTRPRPGTRARAEG